MIACFHMVFLMIPEGINGGSVIQMKIIPVQSSVLVSRTLMLHQKRAKRY